MKDSYDFKARDAYWQKRWEDDGLYHTEDISKKKKYYCLVEFPYPSGEGLHIGHVRSYTAMDIISRKRRLEGFNVLYPMGWDAFGLPTENYAIKTGIHPEEVTKKNTDNFRRQLKSLGISFDWSREINTTFPEYYKWTQWIFLQLYKEGLAYKTKSLLNWCPQDKTVLANEEVIDGICERCGAETEKKEKEQWMLAITKYADRLDKDLDEVDYTEAIKIQQRNWIGKSQGTEVDFKIQDSEETLSVFTTRVDTLFSAAFMVIAPEHDSIQRLKNRISNYSEIEIYINEVRKKQDVERNDVEKEKTGIEVKGIIAINPINNKVIPIWIGEFVIGGYGTGAVFADAHDNRDFKMAKKYNIPISISVLPEDAKKQKAVRAMEECFTGDGILVNSNEFDEMTSADAREAITKWLTKKKLGRKQIQYKLRDWVFSRQRYWGEPIPMVFCEACGWSSLPESELPLELPKIEKYEPTDTGESPLASLPDWVNTTCPTCKGSAKRETDTMPNWAGSSWYFLRYTDPKNNKALADKKRLHYFTPVDWYNGGMEHTTLHLLYSRFWHKFLYDIGIVPTKEPYMKRTSHGMILAEGGEKMSKSKGNVINPDSIIEKFGVDTLRTYEMFIGPFNQAIAWNDNDIYGAHRFLIKVFELVTGYIKAGGSGMSNKTVLIIINQSIKKVSDDIENMSFNTAISQLMILINSLKKQDSKDISREVITTLLTLLAPFAPHLAEELWKKLGENYSVHQSTWPKEDKKYLFNETVFLPIQVNGKVRGKLEVTMGSTEKLVLDAVYNDKQIARWLENSKIEKVIYVQDKILNIVIK